MRLVPVSWRLLFSRVLTVAIAWALTIHKVTSTPFITDTPVSPSLLKRRVYMPWGAFSDEVVLFVVFMYFVFTRMPSER